MAIQFSVVHDLNETKRLWETFSPHKTIDDEWGFRFAWTEPLGLQLHFIVGSVDGHPIGLLPLQRNTNVGIGQKLLQAEKPFLEFFGGVDTDDNAVFLFPEYRSHAHEFFEQIQTPAILTSLTTPVTLPHASTTHYLDRFELDLRDIADFSVFLQKHFDGKSRQRLINRMNHFHKHYSVSVKDGNASDLSLLFEYSKQRFGTNSSFHMEYRQHVFQKLAKQFPVDIFVIHLDDIPKAIAFGIMYKESYISLNMGYDYEIRDLAKLVFATQIQRAIEKGYTRYDAGQGDNGWKEGFHLIKIPQYKLVLNF